MLWPEHIAVALWSTRCLQDRAPWRLRAIALMGVMPDVASPHLELADRLSATSHTPIALAVVTCGLLLWGWAQRQTAFAACLAIAYTSHLLLDGISGGIPGIGSTTIGATWVPHTTWMTASCVAMASIGIIVREAPGERWRQMGLNLLVVGLTMAPCAAAVAMSLDAVRHQTP